MSPTIARLAPREDLPPLDEEPDPSRKLLAARPTQARLAEFVDYYNLRRYHESLSNLPPVLTRDT